MKSDLIILVFYLSKTLTFIIIVSIGGMKKMNNGKKKHKILWIIVGIAIALYVLSVIGEDNSDDDMKQIEQSYTLQVAVQPLFIFKVIVAFPFLTAETFPFLLTVATFLLSVVQLFNTSG